MHEVEKQLLNQVDEDIQYIVKALWENDVPTCWSCSGKVGHLCSRPVIIIPTSCDGIKDKVKKVMQDLNIEDYWLLKVHSHIETSSGMKEYFMLEIMNPEIDWIGYPIPYRRTEEVSKTQG